METREDPRSLTVETQSFHSITLCLEFRQHFPESQQISNLSYTKSLKKAQSTQFSAKQQHSKRSIQIPKYTNYELINLITTWTPNEVNSSHFRQSEQKSQTSVKQQSLKITAHTALRKTTRLNPDHNINELQIDKILIATVAPKEVNYHRSEKITALDSMNGFWKWRKTIYLRSGEVKR